MIGRILKNLFSTKSTQPLSKNQQSDYKFAQLSFTFDNNVGFDINFILSENIPEETKEKICKNMLVFMTAMKTGELCDYLMQNLIKINDSVIISDLDKYLSQIDIINFKKNDKPAIQSWEIFR